MTETFWQGRRVFLTGHTGFKGAWLSLWLQAKGADVTGFALEPPTTPSLFEAARVGEGMTSIIGDIREADRLAKAMADAKPEIVFHLAAQPLVRYAYNNPVETYAVNIMGLVHLFEAVRASETVRAVVNVTSDKCYENREWVWGYRESEPMGGYDPYSSSKGCAELITSAYRRSYFHPDAYADHGIALASGRAGNVIGGGDWAADRLVPDIMRAMDAQIPVKVRNPVAVRPWQHVLEPLNGYMILAERLYRDGPEFAEGWNFGPGLDDTRPVEWIVKRLTSLWGDGASWVLDQDANAPHEARFLSLDCAKAHADLKWRPVWDLGTALEHITFWHKAHRADEDMRLVTLSQIEHFERQKMAEE
ncbi:MAG: CDP-glucose 4,6-dehydratase [Rhodospirillaceae bacterium]